MIKYLSTSSRRHTNVVTLSSHLIKTCWSNMKLGMNIEVNMYLCLKLVFVSRNRNTNEIPIAIIIFVYKSLVVYYLYCNF